MSSSTTESSSERIMEQESLSPSQETQHQQQHHGWTVCPLCHGEGKLTRIPSRKARLRYKRSKTQAQTSSANGESTTNTATTPMPPLPAPMRIDPCTNCNQTGIVAVESKAATNNNNDNANPNNNNYPTVAIIGGGLGGLAVAIACQHRNIPYRVFERDTTFSERRQGYGLTMQQASRSLASFGISNNLSHGITSTKHVVHNIHGEIVGEWGLRKWGHSKKKKVEKNGDGNSNQKSKRKKKRQNIHIARQALREELLNRVNPSNVIWGHKLINIMDDPNESFAEGNHSDDKPPKSMKLEFLQEENQRTVTHTANIIVGADGIRSTVRQYVVNDDKTPLRYLDCLVVLGICPLDLLQESTLQEGELLDGQTVFQTADGSTRIYCMPFSHTEYMWQLSFPMSEAKAKETSRQGCKALKEQALLMCDGWHNPIIELLQNTPIEMISGYPVYDRDLLTLDLVQSSQQRFNHNIALIGDAAHPMSPFKGQGANQALIDALVLVRSIYANCCRNNRPENNKNKISSSSSDDNENQNSIQQNIEAAIDKYYHEMTIRSSKKVQASADAAQFLHTNIAIQKGDMPRGSAAAAMATTTTDDNCNNS